MLNFLNRRKNEELEIREDFEPKGEETLELALSPDEGGGPYKGIPQWMRPALRHWQMEALMTAFRGDSERSFYRLQNLMKVTIPTPKVLYNHIEGYPHSKAVVDYFQLDDDMCLKLTDHLVSLIRPSHHTNGNLWVYDIALMKDDEDISSWLSYMVQNPTGQLREIISILNEAGSVWTVGVKGNRLGLALRVNETSETSIAYAVANYGESGKMLSRAWIQAFGRTPNPREAYRCAIEAVEDAALPALGLGKNETDTLGRAISLINGKEKEALGWTLPFQSEDKFYSSGKALVAMMKTLKSGQVDRHGGVKIKEDITQEAAESAVFLAITLVQLFESGAVSKIPES